MPSEGVQFFGFNCLSDSLCSFFGIEIGVPESKQQH